MPTLDPVVFLTPGSIGSAIEVTVASIASPTELNGVAAAQGDIILARTTEAGSASQTWYYADTTSDAESLPYIVSSATAGVKFLAFGGAYNRQEEAFSGGINLPSETASRIVTTDSNKDLDTPATVTTSQAVALQGTTTVIDGSFSIVGSADATKTIKFEVDAQTTADDLTINSGAQTDDRTTTFPVMSGNTIIAVSDTTLTATRVPFAGTNGVLTDSADMTYAAGVFTLGDTTGRNLIVSSTSTVTAAGVGGAAYIAGAVIIDGNAYFGQGFKTTGTPAAFFGAGPEITYTGANRGQMACFDRTAAVFRGFDFNALDLNFLIGGTSALAIDASLNADFTSSCPRVRVNNTTDSSSTTTGAFQVIGGIGFGVTKSLFGGGIKSASPTLGVGYATGAGGTVAQGSGSGKATTVVLNTVCGTITMDGANLNADTSVAFTFTNSAIASTDYVAIQHNSVGTLGGYVCVCTPGSGTATVTVRNVTPGNLAEAIVLRFVVIKAVTS